MVLSWYLKVPDGAALIRPTGGSRCRPAIQQSAYLNDKRMAVQAVSSIQCVWRAYDSVTVPYCPGRRYALCRYQKKAQRNPEYQAGSGWFLAV